MKVLGFIALLFILEFLYVGNSNYWYSIKLVSAIKNEDFKAIERIVAKKPYCVNVFPSITPKLWHAIMGYRVLYPLNVAVCYDNMEIVKFLVEHGGDVNCNDGYTPLACAYMSKMNNWYQISCYLISAGASLDYTTEFYNGPCVLLNIVGSRVGDTLFEVGPEKEDEVNAAFYYALKHCDLKKQDWPLVLNRSVENNRLEIVHYLLEESYCNVNDVTYWGESALMSAETPEMVEYLLEKGADKDCQDSHGKTAYDYAIQYERKDILSLLK